MVRGTIREQGIWGAEEPLYEPSRNAIRQPDTKAMAMLSVRP